MERTAPSPEQVLSRVERAQDEPGIISSDSVLSNRVAKGIYKAKPAAVFSFDEIREAQRLMDGTRVLRFTSFRTSNGPDVHVYMVAADDAKDVAAVENAGFVDLGVIKGDIGDQNYTLSSDLDLAKYRAVSIWCKRFSVNFGAAALRPAAAAQNQ